MFVEGLRNSRSIRRTVSLLGCGTMVASLIVVMPAAARAQKVPANDPIKYLRALPASDIVAASKQISANRTLYGGYGEGMDGHAILRPPPEVFRSHDEVHVPMIVGSTAQDSSLTGGVSALMPNGSPEETHAWMDHALQVFYGKYPDLLQRAQQIYGLRACPNEVSSYPPDGSVQEQMGGDLHHRCSVVTTASWHSAVAPTYVCEFSRPTPGHLPSHEADLRFVFGYMSEEEVVDTNALEFADIVQTYWTDFATTGNSNGPGTPLWPQYDSTARQAMDFATHGPIARSKYHAVACGPYIDLMNRQPTPLFVNDGT